VSANVAMGGFTLHVRQDVGVSVDATTFLASFEKEGLVRRGDSWVTPNYAAAARHVTVHVHAMLGAFTLLRDAR